MSSPGSGADRRQVRREDGGALFAQFVQAISAGNDEQAEALCQQLTAADEASLTELLVASNLDARWWALRALALCGTAQSVVPVVASLDAAQNELRQVAALTLGHLYARAPEAVVPSLPRLVALLADADGAVRQAAMMALSMCNDDAVPLLAETLAGSHQGARTRAAQALRRIGSLPAAIVLYGYLEDANHLVRTHAYEALDEMGLLENILVTL
ncbi:MAG: HEAT repeat domain-containing protein [Caldilineaceae bacterium]|nr:HEAT repeat domain-containing protein [Caldilineaceae bacterium]